MTENTVSTTLSIDSADALFLQWASGVNASGLFREELARQMAYRDIDRSQLVDLVDQALDDDSLDLADLTERTANIGDLEELLETNRTTPNDD